MKKLYATIIIFTLLLIFVIYKAQSSLFGNIKVGKSPVHYYDIHTQPSNAHKEKAVTVEDDYILKASEFVQQKDSHGAINALSEGISKQPTNANLYSMRGVHYHLIGKDEESLKDHKKAIELTTEKLCLASMYTNKAITEIALKQPANAERDFKKALEYKEPYYITHLEYGKFLLDQGKRDLAIEYLKTAKAKLAEVGPEKYFAEADALLKKVEGK